MLLFSSLAFYLYDKSDFKKKTFKNLSILADVTGNMSSGGLYFADTMTIYENLQNLKVNPYIVEACIYDTNQVIMATYSREGNKYSNFKAYTLEYYTTLEQKKSLIVYRPIKGYENEIIGSIYIKSDIKEYYERTKTMFLVISIISLASLLIGVIIAMQLQKIISKPIIQLSKVMKEISEKKDFSLRLEEKGNDETGKLIRVFNIMLEQIEKQNIALNLAKEQAESSAKIKEQFVATISHEIRTPLNAIVGMTNLLKNTNVSEEQREYLAHITTASDNLLILINDILDFSKIEAGKIEFESIEFNLRETINEVVSMLEQKAKDKNLILNVDIQKNIPDLIIGDKYRLSQVLLNLVGNGIKFTEKGSVSIEVRSIEDNENSILLLFSVIDTGIGIRPQKQKTIFDSFTQENSDTTRKYGGSGLGLTISKQLVELQGGRIFLYSKVGEGSNFSFYLNFKKTSAINKGITEEKKKEIDDNIIIKGYKALIVDDNKVNQVLAKKLLEKQGMFVDVAENGKIAIEKIEKNHYDIILLDLYMPDMDGYDTAKIIRNHTNEKIRKIPIIAITGAALEKERIRCMKIGINDYIAKPYNPEVLFDKISKLINNGRN
ncbi:MAG: hypothetical protein Kow0068_06270 [Marinilabiliales bacterium]